MEKRDRFRRIMAFVLTGKFPRDDDVVGVMKGEEDREMKEVTEGKIGKFGALTGSGSIYNDLKRS